MVRLRTLVWLALRNLGRELRRSALTAAAMAIGLALLILSRTLADGAHEDWIDAGVRLGAGHVTINAPGYRDSESLDDRLSAAQLQASLAAVADAPTPDPPLASVRVTTRGLASSPEGALPAWIVGVDATVETAFSKLGEEVTDGRYLEDGDRLHAYIGAGMAERLGVRTGSRMVLTAQAAPGDIEGQLVRVVGIYRTGVGALDQSLVHIPLGTARSWLGVEGATTVAVLLTHSSFTDAVVAGVRGRVDPAGAEVVGWPVTQPDLYSALKLDDGGDWAFHMILFAIVALAILNAVFMSVLHRQREMGLLRALGLSGRETGLVVLLEGILLTIASGIVGVLLGLAVVWFFLRDGLDLSGMWPEEFNLGGVAFDPVLYPVIEARHVVQSAIMTVAIGLSASAYPAWQAGRLDPAESVKVE
ncbi:MAG: ABC transporter permease [Gemmatimonadetes bacterium]|nr:ABC transporter permease [Gemmatimonadota bacterium]MDE2678142.1 ABC transporter permease [Gemmatimonadota bacterium]MXX33967.1 ABC transporter permease [Gemmatimonadota bacterium]MYA10351.1 ABC transporter permease [Gemmatimonadota bacterium]MYD15277.1 ABC transporter permease [Gemmatimonadota bacterium]